MQPLNIAIQSSAVDLLQAIIARGEIDIISVEGIEAIVIGKLFICVHTNRLDLQNKLLHLSHSLISAMTTYETESVALASRQRQIEGAAENLSQEGSLEANIRKFSLNPLMIQTLVDGISVPANRPVLQHWLDFILMAVPQFQPALQPVVTPLNDCICRQLLFSLGELHRAAAPNHDQSRDIHSTVTDAEFIMLLNGLERLVLLSLAYTSEVSSAEDETATVDKGASESSGLLGYVSGVFGSENLQQPEEQLTVYCLLSWV